MLCCISGKPPLEPVVSKTSGCLYEKRLIEKYIAENGRCPKTGETLRFEDLLLVSSGGTSGVTRPPTSATTIPSLLETLHQEWDALMLEQFSLRQQLTQAQQELAHALFQYDAAERVTARLLKENKVLKEQLRGAAGAAGQNNAATSEGTDDGASRPILPENIVEGIESQQLRLQQARKRREPPRNYCSEKELTNFVELDSTQPHGSSGVYCIEATDMFGSRSILTGGAEGRIIRYDADRRQIAASGVGHKKTVRCVRDLGNYVVSCSDDTTVRVWKADGSAFVNHGLLTAHDGAVNGIAVLPGDQYVLSGGSDGKLVFSDLSRVVVIAKVSAEEATVGINSVDLHPDGHLAATGTAGRLLLWDVRSLEVELNLGVPRGASVTCSSFNENGYTLAVGTSTGTVQLWDMRHIEQQLGTLTFADNPIAKPTPVNRCSFDKFGTYLAIATNNVKVWNWKEKTELAVLSSHMGPVTGVSWGGDANWLASSSLDKSARIYGKI